jgi:hypothetical protein
MALTSSTNWAGFLMHRPIRVNKYVPPPPPPPASQKDLNALHLQVQNLSNSLTDLQTALSNFTNALSQVSNNVGWHGQVAEGFIIGLQRVLSQLKNLQGNAVTYITVDPNSPPWSFGGGTIPWPGR